MIDACAFGSMTIDHQSYTSDLMIYPDGRIVDAWRRAAGHRLDLDDIRDLLSSGPDILVVGTGIYGLMRIRKNLKDVLADRKIELKAARTRSAVKEFNRLIQTARRVAACFHLTC